MNASVTVSYEDFQLLVRASVAIGEMIGCDIFTDVNDNNERHQIGVLKANVTNVADTIAKIAANNPAAATIVTDESAVDDDDDDDEDEEEMLTIHYAHYDCPVDPDVTWDDEYECACDSDCPACGTRAIQAVSWHSIDEACGPECDPHRATAGASA